MLAPGPGAMCINHHESLVGGFNHLEKYDSVNWKDDIPYMKWKIKFMFETTRWDFNSTSL